MITIKHLTGIKWTKFCCLLIFWAVVPTRAESKNSGGSSGGGSFNAGAGLNAGYHTDAQTWVRGKKDQATYGFTGYSWLFYLTNLDQKNESGKLMPPTLAIWGDKLTSKYSYKDPSGGTARETIKTQGIGLGYVGRDPGSNIAGTLLLGLERAYLDQSGDTTRSQKYPYGVSSRIGLGWSPLSGSLAIDLRIDWIFKHFPSTKSKGESLKTMQQQSFEPMVGISYNR